VCEVLFVGDRLQKWRHCKTWLYAAPFNIHHLYLHKKYSPKKNNAANVTDVDNNSSIVQDN